MKTFSIDKFYKYIVNRICPNWLYIWPQLFKVEKTVVECYNLARSSN